MLKPYFQKKFTEVGCDEAGRGCLAGPVVAAAVILPRNFKNKLLNDSKQIKESDRLQLREVIEKEALAWAIAMISPSEIDRLNILNASILAMQLSIDQLNIQPEFIIIDGNRFKPYRDVPYETIIKGDTKYASIAAASILAKTYRDEYMVKWHKEFPEFGWLTNKGYPTIKHRKAIADYGITPLHRLSFRLLRTSD